MRVFPRSLALRALSWRWQYLAGLHLLLRMVASKYLCLVLLSLTPMRPTSLAGRTQEPSEMRPYGGLVTPTAAAALL